MKIYIRKLYSFLIVFIAAVFLFPAACSMGGGDDGDDPPVDNPIKGEMTAATAAKIFDYTVDAVGVTISLFKNVSALKIYLNDGDTLVLNTIGGRPVSVIAPGAFNKTSGGAEALSDAGVSGVRLPETLTDIDPNSFTGAGITVLIVPASVVSDIGSQVFDDLETNSGAEIVEVPSSGAITIATPEDMAKIGVHTAYPLNGEYLLMANIELTNWMPIGAAAEQPFTGTFYGSGRTITLNGFNPAAQNINFMIMDYNDDPFSMTCLGIFWGSDGAVIRDFNLVLNLGTEDSPLSWSSCSADVLLVGGVVGYTEQTTLQNITLSGKLIANRPTKEFLIGGITSGGEDGTVISGCSSSLKITASGGGKVTAGGIAEGLHNATSRIENCHTTGDIHVTGTKGSAGGLVRDFRGTIKNCFTTGNIRATATTEEAEAGGLVSYAAGDGDSATTISIINSYATGAIHAESTSGGGALAGGIVGSVNCGNGRTVTIKNCYATGDVSSTVAGTASNSVGAGGLIGQVRRDYSSGGFPSVTIKNCYATGNVTGSTNMWFAGGIIAQYSGEIDTYAIRNCAALNPAIMYPNTSEIGRVVGSFSGPSILSGNIAYDGMTLNGTPVDSGSGDTGDGKNGASTSTEDLKKKSTWTSLFSASFDGNSDSAPWVWDDAAECPKLYWQ